MKLKGNTRMKLSQAGWFVLGCVLLPLSSFGALFPVTQSSLPAGLVSQSAIIEQGEIYTSINPQLNKNGYTFGYWKINGTRQAGPDGRSLTHVSTIVQGDSNFTAHYYADNEDTDGDGVNDWFEYRMFGDLSKNPSDDSDGDGFSNKRESELGQDALIVDFIEPGGIAGRMSNTFTYADTSMSVVTIKSNPSGFITTSITNKELNASVTTQSLNGATNGSHFAYWTVNGVRQASPNGVASSKVTLNVSGATQIIAHYIPSTEDTDGDGVLDWFEMYQFGNLASGPEDDSDGDGFSNKREGELGQEATIAEFVEAGGIAGRMSNTFSYADTSMVLATITSDPKGFITESITYKESNSTVTTQNLNGATNGSHFAYWTINGVLQFGPTGVSQSKVSATITADTIFTAHYIPSTEDTDTDAVMDWFEMYQFGNLTQGPNDDPDGDGYSNKREGELGQEATISEFVENGGIAGRMSNSVTYYLQVNNPPNALNLSSTNVHANKPTGELVGIFQPSDPDDSDNNQSYVISLLDGNGSTDRNKFSISGRNLLTTSSLSVGNYLINVRVSDDENASLDKNFTIQAIHDPNKDDDNDSLTYAQEQALGTSDQNPDSDGDGFSDLVESNYGSNPIDANSTANAAPTDLNNSTSASFFENQPIGTLITDFNATDSDVNATLTYSISGPNAHLFTIDQNGTLFTHAIFDFETNASVYNLSVRVTDEHNASQQISKNIILKDINETPISLSLSSNTLLENQPTGTVVGEFNATDPDVNATLTYHLVNGNGSNQNYLFILDSNGTLKTATTFDFETNASTYTITVQAKDELNATTESNFSISLLNVIEDFDQDGIEDHHDTDDDNDGFTDSLEITYGSDPRDANSTANAPPQITLGSTFPNQLDANGVFQIGHPENQTEIIRVTASDPDGDDLNYSIYGWQDLPHFEINASSGDLRFKLAPDFEELTDHNKDGVYGIVLRVSDGHVHTDQPVWIWLQNENEAPYDLNASAPLQFLEEQPAGTLVGNFSAHDSDANTTLSYTMLDGNGSSGNQYFTLDPNGTLTTAQVFDYENNESNYSIRIKVSDEYNASREGIFVIKLLNDPSDDFNPTDANYTSPSGGYQTPPGDYQSPDGNYSSPSSDYQTPGTDYQSPSNSYEPSPENNQSIPNPTSQIYVPIVETFPADHDGNGTYHLGGRILADGGSSPFEVGIVLSTKISLSDPIRIAAQPDQNSSVFHVSYTDLLPGKTYYLRAYAVNQAGENQGSLKKFKTAQKTDPNSWYSKTEALPGGWKMSNWLGAFRPTEHQWIYHAEMGWLYPSPMEDGSLWLWNQTDGWSWTQDGVYPYLFRWKDSAWVYLQGRINGQILYYNYSTQSYE